MPAVSVQISASGSDAFQDQSPGAVDTSSVRVRMDSNAVATSRYVGGFRFEAGGVALAFARIIDARLSVWLASGADNPSCDIFGELAPNPVDFSGVNPAINLRPRTNASVAWVASGVGAGAYVQSPNLRTIIQELVDQPTTGSPGTINLLVVGRSSPDATFRAFSYDAGSNPAKLDIVYEAPRSRATIARI